MTTQLHQPIEQYLTANLPAYLDLLQSMVAINSFTANPAGVNALGELTARAFANLGFTAETVQSVNPNYGKHLILTRNGRTGRKIGLVSHLDTVFPEAEEQANDFRWRPESGPAGERIYGPGTVDIKGGTVLIYMVLMPCAGLLPTFLRPPPGCFYSMRPRRQTGPILASFAWTAWPPTPWPAWLSRAVSMTTTASKL
jgi:glutamate carboxypeptidase